MNHPITTTSPLKIVYSSVIRWHKRVSDGVAMPYYFCAIALTQDSTDEKAIAC
ncbi:MAG TPA: hypothetical protein V6C91_04700 [Coleofasciculaceae cyanobacterium]